MLSSGLGNGLNGTAEVASPLAEAADFISAIMRPATLRQPSGGLLSCRISTNVSPLHSRARRRLLSASFRWRRSTFVASFIDSSPLCGGSGARVNELRRRNLRLLPLGFQRSAASERASERRPSRWLLRPPSSRQSRGQSLWCGPTCGGSWASEKLEQSGPSARSLSRREFRCGRALIATIGAIN